MNPQLTAILEDDATPTFPVTTTGPRRENTPVDEGLDDGGDASIHGFHDPPGLPRVAQVGGDGYVDGDGFTSTMATGVHGHSSITPLSSESS